MRKIKYFVRVEGSIKTVFGFSSKKKAARFQKNTDGMIGIGFTDFGTLSDGFLEFAYNKKRHGEIVDMRDYEII